MTSLIKNVYQQQLTHSQSLLSKLVRRYQCSDFGVSCYPYNLTGCESPRFLWYRNAKVATRSILGHLSDNNIELSINGSALIYSPQHYCDYFKFAFVRNPFDRLVSAWANKVVDCNYFGFTPRQQAKYQDFDKFLEFVETLDLRKCDVHLRRQVNLIDLSNIDFLGRLENFSKDFDQICDELKLPHMQRQANQSSRASDYKRYYSESTMAKAASLYFADLNIFGYKF
jgi:hypothetical protein